MAFEQKYNKHYKKLLLIPALLLLFSLVFLTYFTIQNNDIIKKDISLTGGTTITISTSIPSSEVEQQLQEQIQDFEIRTLSDNTGKQTQIIITATQSPEELQPLLEDTLGFKLTGENSSIEFTGSRLGQNFYKQIITAVILAFFLMAAVVFIIFVKNWKLRIITILLNLLLTILMGALFLEYNFFISTLPILILMAFLIYIYIKNSVPAFAVMLSAFADIIMTLALVNLLGFKISTAGIIAFFMLIGYSVDTDILLTTRILKRKNSINSEMWDAFKTGTIMTITSILAILAALIVVYSLHTVLNQIFSILLIGLGFDLINTWLTNASIIKWYAETK